MDVRAHRFVPFEMERMMSAYENAVGINLSESGSHPVTVGELIAGADIDLSALSLGYPQTNGTPALRSAIASMYDGATEEEVFVTVGAIEANYLAVSTLTEPGDEVAVMTPNYMAVWGQALNRGVIPRRFELCRERGWALDVAQLEDVVGSRTRLIAVCNPNNPTGKVLTATEMDAIVRVAERSGAWILADEVYRGTERTCEAESPSFWGRYDRVLALGSLSKAYGLPGLRLGWIVAEPSILQQIWRRHEYTTICHGMASDALARVALAPGRRTMLIDRARRYIRRGWPILQQWAEGRSDVRAYPPDATAVALVDVGLPVSSIEVVERLRKEQSVLVVPGEHFGIGRCVRVSFGVPEQQLADGLSRMGALFDEISGRRDR